MEKVPSKLRNFVKVGALAALATVAAPKQAARAVSTSGIMPKEPVVAVNKAENINEKNEAIRQKIVLDKALRDLIDLDSEEREKKLASKPDYNRALDRQVANMIIYRTAVELAGKESMHVTIDQYYDAIKKISGYYLKQFAATRGNKDGMLGGQELEYAEKDMLGHTGLKIVRDQLLQYQMNKANRDAYDNALKQFGEKAQEPIYQFGNNSTSK